MARSAGPELQLNFAKYALRFRSPQQTFLRRQFLSVLLYLISLNVIFCLVLEKCLR
jgi:hypothetical protein